MTLSTGLAVCVGPWVLALVCVYDQVLGWLCVYDLG